MTRLTDTQLVILTAAAQGHDGNALPLPGSLRGGAPARWWARSSRAGSPTHHAPEWVSARGDAS
jgi:hypothetical protein